MDKFIIDGDTLKEYSGTEVIIPDGVVKIGDDAFSYCSHVISIVMQNSVTTIGQSAFRNCYWLTSVIISDNVTAIGQSAFRNCSKLTSVNIPDNVTTIGRYAFCGCDALVSVTIPESVKTIGKDAFLGCISLKSIVLPTGILAIGGLDSYGIPKSVKVSSSSSLYKGCITSKILDTNMTNINMAAVMFYCENTALFYPEDCCKFDLYISRRSGRIIDKIIQKERMSTIAFFANHGFITVDNIDVYIEKANRNEKKQAVASLLNIKNTLYSREEIEAAEDKRLRHELEVNPNSVTELKKTWGVANNDDGTCRITSYKGTDTDIVIPAKIGERPVKEIAKRMSSRGNLKNVESIVIPEGITTIGDLAFKDCSRLRTVIFPISVTELNELWSDSGAFEGCDRSLLTIYAPKGSGIERNVKHARFVFKEIA